MKRHQTAAALLSAILGLTAAGASQARVTYLLAADFESGFGLTDGHLTYVSPDFITTDRVIPTREVAFCMFPGFDPDLCERPEFAFALASDPYPAFDVLVFGGRRPPPGPILAYFFNAGTFGHAGVYEALSYSASPARLTVVESGVPETATWATLLLGFSAIGVAMRGRAPGRAVGRA